MSFEEASAAPEVTPEATEPETIEAPTATPAPHKAFAALAAKEAALRKQTEAFKSQQSAIDEYSALAASAKGNPAAVLEKFGLTLDDLISHALGGLPEEDANDPLTVMQKKLAKIEEREQEQEAARLGAQREEALGVVGNAILSVIQDTAKYELINATASQELVFDTLFAVYTQTNQVPDVAEIADFIELQLEQEAEKYTKTAKVRNKFQNMKADSRDPEGSRGVYASRTSDVYSTTSNADVDNMSDDERIQYAVAQLKRMNKQ